MTAAEEAARYAARYAEICAERDELLAEVAELRGLLRPVPLVPPIPGEWGLTPLERKVLATLKQVDGVLTRDRAMAALYGGAPEVPGAAIVNVVISRLRGKLAAQGLDDIILTKWKRGWYVPAEAWARLESWSAAE